MLKKTLTFSLMFFLLVTTITLRIKAEDITVIKSGTVDTFTDNFSIDELTTFIDVSKITKNNYTWESTIENVVEIESSGSKIIAINKHLNKDEEINTTTGSIILTFKDVFVNKDGSNSDLVLELSNIYIKQLSNNSSEEYFGIISNGKTLITSAYANDFSRITSDQKTNRSINFKIYKKDSTNDKFVFGILDIDVADYTVSADYNGNYVESIEAVSGYGNVYMPSSSILKVVGGKMMATAVDDDTWNTGFITTLSSNNESIWKGSGNNTNTNLFETLPFFMVKDSVIGGGEIKYKTSTEEKDQAAVVSGKGENVSIVTRPLPGYKIKKITVDGSDVTPNDKYSEFTYNFDNINDNHEIIAEYEPFTYKINYDGNGAEGTMASQDFTSEDEKMTSSDNAFSKDGYKFEGFKVLDKDGNPILDENGKEIIVENPEDFKSILTTLGDGGEITLQAKWTKTHWVKYVDPFTGEEVELEFEDGISDNSEPIAPEVPTHSGFRFVGWKRNVDSDSNITYTAIWEEIPNKIIIPKTGIG